MKRYTQTSYKAEVNSHFDSSYVYIQQPVKEICYARDIGICIFQLAADWSLIRHYTTLNIMFVPSMFSIRTSTELDATRALIPSLRLLFALSTSPLDCGCLTDAKRWKEDTVSLTVGADPTIGLRRENQPIAATLGCGVSIILGRDPIFEAVIPAEIGMPTYRNTAVDVVNNDEELRLNLDLLEERRELAAMSEAKSNNDASHVVAGGKLGPKWEDPYEVTDALGNEAYKLRSTDGTMLPRTWNVTNIKRCYL
nr:hypothetical protein [Tanacetum cinerariifolium]